MSDREGERTLKKHRQRKGERQGMIEEREKGKTENEKKREKRKGGKKAKRC